MNIDTFFSSHVTCKVLALKCNLVNGHQDQVKPLEIILFFQYGWRVLVALRQKAIGHYLCPHPFPWIYEVHCPDNTAWSPTQPTVVALISLFDVHVKFPQPLTPQAGTHAGSTT